MAEGRRLWPQSRSRRPDAANQTLSMKRAFVPSIAVLASIAILCAPAAHPTEILQLVDKTALAHPNALWHIVHDLCVVDMKASGNPAPCARVDLASGYAVLKDIERPTQYLLLPTARVTGVESPQILSPESPNYWQAAWSARHLLEQRVGRALPRGDVGLAINSMYGRTQNQLHIHIDCVRPEVLATLRSHSEQIGPRGLRLRVGPHGRRYLVRWIAGEELGAHDPFKVLASSDARARADMARETLVLIAAARPDGAPGFVLLTDRAEAAHNDEAAGEELLDHCPPSRAGRAAPNSRRSGL